MSPTRYPWRLSASDPASGGPRSLLVNLLLGLTVATLLLVGLEGALRLLPIERWERKYPNVSYPLFIPGEGADAGWYVTNPHFKNSMNYNRFPQVKPPGVKRVFVLGGSAALGWPGVVETSFSGYMQRALEAVAPGRYEIINAAAMSYGSHRVLDLLTDIVQLDPDLVIVWSGNNEYIERNALSRYARWTEMGRLQRVLRRSAVYRSLRLALQVTVPTLFVPPAGSDLTDPRNLPQVRRGMLGRSAATDAEVQENYRANLRKMASLLRSHGIPGIFCTVPVNLSGWQPIDVPPEIVDPVQRQHWEGLLETASRLRDSRVYAPAAAKFEQLLEVTPRYARGNFLLGDCYMNLGRTQDALRAFELACTHDPRPIRAFASFAEIVREVATTEGMRLLDLRHAVLAQSGNRLSGTDLFLDYVHPNDSGHRFIAVVVLQGAMPLIGPDLSLPTLAQLVNSDDWMVHNRFNQADIYYTLGMTLFNNGDLAGAEQAYQRALVEEPNFADALGNLAVLYVRRGELATARSYYERALAVDPGTIHASNLALLLYQQGDRAGARVLWERLQRQGVVDMKMFFMLGSIAFDEQRYEDALNLLQQAVAAGGDNAEVQGKLGDTYRQLGDEARAAAAHARAKALLGAPGQNRE